ncbi:GNAT family N-acetyltransferase [Phenylobacterium sp.]|jgi:RimJ/RimL family protein N-acetyltransferase|uniref:GNAT family N-acetyltransferase n=1 Tax=Phenylobacterium sp. TaxID=1871053 RepID=UPI0025F723B6|nr:GNAT family N-acetyltransferase [Phenylobacterium sp.]|tara:strand:- start:270 stop:842 length:573 start_codon:yes stop_codon:yes gene_type:complete
MSGNTMATGQAPGPTLETERLILRPPAMTDFEAWCAFSEDEEAARYIGGPMTPAQVWRSMMTIAGAWSMEGFSMFSVIEKESGRWIGRLGPWRPHGWPGTEVGWGIIRDCWGRGYATEGATAAMDFAFDQLGWDEVIHTIEPANANSQAVAQRLGSAVLRQAHLPVPMDVAVDVWGQSRAAWRARRAPSG